MEEAVAIEDFQEAARLKGALDAVTATDTVAEVMVELKRALEEERYSDAALYRDKAGAGLVRFISQPPLTHEHPASQLTRVQMVGN
jgi:hypothetical protein